MSYVRGARRFPQTLTYWEKTGTLGYGGDAWASPRTIRCRWEDARVEHLSVAYRAESETELSNARIFTGESLKEGNYVYLGESLVADPASQKGAFPIRNIVRIPSTRGDWYEEMVLL